MLNYVARNLAYKISNYCSAFETLLTTDAAELSHKLSERAAFLLENEIEKVVTFRILKKAYTIRSKLTHGASLGQSQLDELSEIAIGADNILRKILIKIQKEKTLLAIFESKGEKIDEYFETLILR